MPVQPSPDAIVTLSAVKDYLRLTGQDETRDDFLQYWINAVSGSIEQHIRGPVVLRDFPDELHNGSGTPVLAIANVPLVALQHGLAADLAMRDDPAGEWQPVETDVTNILIDPAGPWQLRLYRTVFPAGLANIKVSYRAGYEQVPGAIARVCVEAVAEIFKESNQGTGRLGQRSRSIGGINSSGATDGFYDLAERHRMLLAPFVRVLP